MSEHCVRNTYEAIFALIDVQEIWRRTRPFHKLCEDDKKELSILLKKARKSIENIEGEML
ncbi:MAG: hypothetical protein ACXQTP_05910 [Candidatus Methanofastidiosia archaeon]